MPSPEEIPYEVALRGIEIGTVSLEEFANFLRDLVFLHDRLWIIASGRDRQYDLEASYFYTRYGRPIPNEQKVLLLHLRRESPFEVGFVLQSAIYFGSAAWIFVQIIRGLRLLPGEAEKQQLEIEKLRDEKRERSERIERAVREVTENLPSAPNSRETEIRLIRRDIERISANHLRITEVEVRRTLKSKNK